MILRMNLDFFVKTLCAVPCLSCRRTLPACRDSAERTPASQDTTIDAGASESVSRATLLRYTPYATKVKAFLGLRVRLRPCTIA